MKLFLQYQQLDSMLKQYNTRILNLLCGMLEDKIKSGCFGDTTSKTLKG